MIIMLTAWYPIDQMGAIIEAFKNIPKIPDFVLKWNTYATPDGNNGAKVYNLIYIKEGVSDDAILAIGKIQNHFVQHIKNYNYKVEIVVARKDTLKILS